MKLPATFLVALLWLSSCLVPAAATAAREAADSTAETRIKAAFLFKFCNYVDWPEATFATPASPIVIGVMGSDSIARELEQAVAGRYIQHRPVQVRAYTAQSLPNNVQLLYVGPAAQRSMSAWLERLQEQPVLVVTDDRNGLDSGSSINFAVIDNRVRFDISLTAVHTHQLKLSSQLLSVARQVRGRSP